MNLPSYSVLIPAYNSQNSIGELIDQISNIENKPDAIIVVNDGSTDKTLEILTGKKVIVFDSEENQGKGSALKNGFDIFFSKTTSQYILCMDADFQHLPTSIECFLKKASKNKKSLIIGRREFKIGRMPFLRFLSNKMTSYILSKLAGQKIHDSQCGFRLIKRDILNKIETNENGFQFESEFLLKCAKAQIKIDCVNIPTIYNKGDSNINHINDTYKFMRLILREIFTK